MTLTRAPLPVPIRVLGVAMCLAGCGAQERVVTASCKAPGGDISMSIVLMDAEGGAIGHYNGRQDELGTMLRFVEGADRAEEARWEVVHTVDTRQKRVLPEVFWVRRVHRLELELDVDGEKVTETLRNRIESALVAGSRLILIGAEKQSIDVIEAINRDPEALGVLQQAKSQERYLIVSSVVASQSASLTYLAGWRDIPAAPFVAVGTFNVDDANYHAVYSCEPLNDVAARAQAGKAPVPAVYFYTAIRYDAATKRARTDSWPLEFGVPQVASHRSMS